MTFKNLNVLFRAYNLIIKRITRSAIIVEINTNFTYLVLISAMIALLVILFITFKNNSKSLHASHEIVFYVHSHV